MLMYINLYSDDPKADQKFLFNYADINVMSELRRVSGVGFADILGTGNMPCVSGLNQTGLQLTVFQLMK